MKHFPLVLVLAALALGDPANGAPQPPPTGTVEVEDLRDVAPPTDPQKELEAAAESAYGDGDLERAITLYRDLLSRSLPAVDEARVLLTVAWLETLQARPEVAAQDLERSLYLAPETPLRNELYNEEFARLFLDAKARATAARSRQAADKARAAVQAINAGNLGTARQLLGESLALQPDQPRAVYNLAVVDLREARTDDALAGFERIISLGEARPESVPKELRGLASASAGLVYLTRGQDPEAAAALGRAVTLNPEDGRAWNGLGAARKRLGQRDAAIEAFRRANSLRPDDEEVSDNLGRALIDSGRWVDAVATLLEGTRRRPNAPRLALSLGIAQRGLGNAEGARQSFERTIELDPTNAARLAEQAASFLASLHLEARRYDDAAREARRALAWDDTLVDSWTYLGLAQKESGDLNGARESLERAATLAPERAEAAYNLGTVLLAAGQVAEARAAFQRALEIKPELVAAAEILGRLAAQGGVTPPPNRPTAGRPAGKPTAAKPRLPLDAKLAEANYPELGLRGLRVDAVERGGVAERSALQVADLILRVDGRPLATGQELTDYLGSRAARSTVLLDLLRAGRPLRLTVTLD